MEKLKAARTARLMLTATFLSLFWVLVFWLGLWLVNTAFSLDYDWNVWAGGGVLYLIYFIFFLITSKKV